MYQNPTASQARPSFIIINDYCYFAGKTVYKDNFREVWHLRAADGSLTMVWKSVANLLFYNRIIFHTTLKATKQ